MRALTLLCLVGLVLAVGSTGQAADPKCAETQSKTKDCQKLTGWTRSLENDHGFGNSTNATEAQNATSAAVQPTQVPQATKAPKKKYPGRWHNLDNDVGFGSGEE